MSIEQSNPPVPEQDILTKLRSIDTRTAREISEEKRKELIQHANAVIDAPGKEKNIKRAPSELRSIMSEVRRLDFHKDTSGEIIKNSTHSSLNNLQDLVKVESVSHSRVQNNFPGETSEKKTENMLSAQRGLDISRFLVKNKLKSLKEANPAALTTLYTEIQNTTYDAIYTYGGKIHNTRRNPEKYIDLYREYQDLIRSVRVFNPDAYVFDDEKTPNVRTGRITGIVENWNGKQWQTEKEIEEQNKKIALTDEKSPLYGENLANILAVLPNYGLPKGVTLSSGEKNAQFISQVILTDGKPQLQKWNVVDKKWEAIDSDKSITYKDSLFTYTGALKNGLPIGIGTITHANRDFFKGEFVNGVGLNGTGRKTYLDGSIYVGGFKKGLCDGDGTIRGVNGRVYKGQFTEGNITGQGEMWYENKTGYHKGGFFKGKLEGYGKFIKPDGTFLEGIFSKNKFIRPSVESERK